MTTLLGASASLLIRVGALLFVALGLLLLISAAAMADTISAQPLPLPVPPAETPTITLWRDAAIMAACVVIVALVVWRTKKFDAWADRTAQFHGLGAALFEDELIKRGVVQKPAPVPDVPADLVDDDPAWAAEADKIAAPPAPPPPPPAPRRVTPSTTKVAHTFAAPRARRGEKMQ